MYPRTKSKTIWYSQHSWRWYAIWSKVEKSYRIHPPIVGFAPIGVCLWYFGAMK